MESDKQGTSAELDSRTETRITEMPTGAAAPAFAPNRKRKFDPTKPLDAAEDEAVAQFLATPKSLREFKSTAELGARFGLSRMTIFRRTKEKHVLDRVEYLLRNYIRAGDLFALKAWPRIVRGQVRAAVGGDTKAAVFCLERLSVESPSPLEELLLK